VHVEGNHYYFCITPEKWGYGTPTLKSGGTRNHRTPESYAYGKGRKKEERRDNRVEEWKERDQRLLFSVSGGGEFSFFGGTLPFPFPPLPLPSTSVY